MITILFSLVLNSIHLIQRTLIASHSIWAHHFSLLRLQENACALESVEYRLNCNLFLATRNKRRYFGENCCAIKSISLVCSVT